MASMRLAILLLLFVVFQVRGQGIFWLDVIRTSNGTMHFDGTPLSPESQQVLDTIGVDSTTPTDTYFQWTIKVDGFLAYTFAGTEVASDTSVGYALCEVPFAAGKNECECTWFKFNQTCFKLLPTNGTMEDAIDGCIAEGPKLPTPADACLAKDLQLINDNVVMMKQLYPFSCGAGWGQVLGGGTGDTGTFCFKMFPNKTDWHTAEQMCQGLLVNNVPTHLPAFTSKFSHVAWKDFLQPELLRNFLCQSNMSTEMEFWIGMNDYADDDVATLTSGFMSPNTYSGWVSGSPHPTQPGTCIYWDRSDNLWHERDCSEKLNFFCQTDGVWTGPCDPGWRWLTPLCYKYLDTAMKFNDGDAACQAEDGALVSFHFDYIWQQFESYTRSLINTFDPNGDKLYEDIYIGMQCPSGSVTNQGCYQFTDGSASWATWGASMASSGRCVTASKTTNDHYGWKNGNCNTKRGIVCQKWPERNTGCTNNYQMVGGDGLGICYTYITTPSEVTWPEAEKLCHAAGGVLPNLQNIYYVGGSTTFEVWPNFIEWRASLMEPNDRIWIGWSKYADGSWVANDQSTSQSYTIWAGDSSKLNDDYAISIRGNEDYYPVTDKVTSTANVICQQLEIDCPNNTLYYQTVGNSKCYFTVDQKLNYVEADRVCQDNDARLATFDWQSDWDDFDVLRKVFVNTLYPKDAWVGYSRGPFYGPDTTPFVNIHYGRANIDLGGNGWIPWDTGEPKNALDGKTYCVSLTGQYGQMVMDAQCSSVQGMVCLAPNDYTDGYQTFQDDVFDPFEYHAVDNGTNMTFAQAQARCLDDGGQVPAFHSAQEWDDFLRYRWVKRDLAFELEMRQVWISLVRNSSDSMYWSWSDSAVSNYNWSNWYTGYPTNAPTDLCTMSDYTLGKDPMSWKSVPCTDSYSVICQIRKVKIKNPCKLGYFYLNPNERCFVPLTNYTKLDRLTADAVCQHFGMSLPSFGDSASWTAFNDWILNFNTAARYTTNDTVWSTADLWIGLQNPTDTNGGTWKLDDAKTDYYWPSARWPNPRGKDCVLSAIANSFDWKTADCAATTSTNLICQDIPRKTACLTGFRPATLYVCYKLSEPAVNSYAQASGDCQAYGAGAYLPSFHNLTEYQDFLKQKLIEETIVGGVPMSAPGFWIGLKDTAGNGTWVWEDGSSFNWNHFTPGAEPKMNGQCVVADFSLPNVTWRTEPCNSATNYAVMCQNRLVPQPNPCLDGWALIGNRCYRLMTYIGTETAEFGDIDCSGEHATLPQFDSMAHYQAYLSWQQNLAQMIGMTSSSFFTGLTMPAANTFIWPDGQSLNFTATAPWASGQPGSTAPACVWADTSLGYTWSTLPCTQTTPSLFCMYAPIIENCPTNWKKLGDICYKAGDPSLASLVGTAFTSVEGQKICEVEAGTLPSFHAMKEWTDFNLMRHYLAFKQNVSTYPSAWLGLGDTNQDFVWKWTDASNYNWTNWATPTQPALGSGLDCVSSPAIALITETGPWATTSCTAQNYVVCQLRLSPMSDPCKPQFSFLNESNRCFIPLTNYSAMPRDVADAVCDSLGLSLPSFETAKDYSQFVSWVVNFNTASRWTPSSDKAWPITGYWTGLAYNETSSAWINDDDLTSYSSSEFPLTSSPSGANCLLSQSSNNNFSWANIDCLSTNAPNLICQDVPRSRQCPGLFRKASPAVCYLQTEFTGLNYQDALAACQEIGGTLPSFHNQSEWSDFLRQKLMVEAIQGHTYTEPGLWIGLKDLVGGGYWIWEDNSTVDWTLWSSGQPVIGPKCVIADLSQPDLAWRTVDCTTATTMICQLRMIPPPMTTTTTTSTTSTTTVTTTPVTTTVTTTTAAETTTTTTPTTTTVATTTVPTTTAPSTTISTTTTITESPSTSMSTTTTSTPATTTAMTTSTSSTTTTAPVTTTTTSSTAAPTTTPGSTSTTSTPVTSTSTALTSTTSTVPSSSTVSSSTSSVSSPSTSTSTPSTTSAASTSTLSTAPSSTTSTSATVTSSSSASTTTQPSTSASTSTLTSTSSISTTPEPTTSTTSPAATTPPSTSTTSTTSALTSSTTSSFSSTLTSSSTVTSPSSSHSSTSTPKSTTAPGSSSTSTTPPSTAAPSSTSASTSRTSTSTPISATASTSTPLATAATPTPTSTPVVTTATSPPTSTDTSTTTRQPTVTTALPTSTSTLDASTSDTSPVTYTSTSQTSTLLPSTSSTAEPTSTSSSSSTSTSATVSTSTPSSSSPSTSTPTVTSTSTPVPPLSSSTTTLAPSTSTMPDTSTSTPASSSTTSVTVPSTTTPISSTITSTYTSTTTSPSTLDTSTITSTPSATTSTSPPPDTTQSTAPSPTTEPTSSPPPISEPSTSTSTSTVSSTLTTSTATSETSPTSKHRGSQKTATPMSSVSPNPTSAISTTSISSTTTALITTSATAEPGTTPTSSSAIFATSSTSLPISTVMPSSSASSALQTSSTAVQTSASTTTTVTPQSSPSPSTSSTTTTAIPSTSSTLASSATSSSPPTTTLSSQPTSSSSASTSPATSVSTIPDTSGSASPPAASSTASTSASVSTSRKQPTTKHRGSPKTDATLPPNSQDVVSAIPTNCSDQTWKQVGNNCYKVPSVVVYPDGSIGPAGVTGLPTPSVSDALAWPGVPTAANASAGSSDAAQASQARALCQAEGGDLPSFHSLTEWNEFNAMRRTNAPLTGGISTKAVWLGLTDFTGDFEWSDGSNYNWSFWQPKSEPKLGSSPICAQSKALSSDADNGSWTAASCDSNGAVLCQQRLNSIGNPCKSGFVYIQQCNRCFVPMSEYANITRDVAEGICDAIGLSLPSFSSLSGWKAFTGWLSNINDAARWSRTDFAWPISDFWIGIRSTSNTTNSWQYDDGQTTYSPSELPLTAASTGADCVLSRQLANFDWTSNECQLKANNLICQDIPRAKSCPGAFRQATPTTCYLPLDKDKATGSYDKAQTTCRSLGASLPSMHNDSEWKDFLTQKQIQEALDGHPIERGIWIGLKDGTGGGRWIWEDRTSYDWNHWSSGQPTLGPRCAIADVSSADTTWKTEECESTVNYSVICQLRLEKPPKATNCTEGWEQINGNCYKAPNASLLGGPNDGSLSILNMDKAQELCKVEGGQVPSFHSLQEWKDFSFMRRFLASDASAQTAGPTWIGLNGSSLDLRWKWADGSNYNWTHWDPQKQPILDTGSLCVAARAMASETDAGYWYIEKCASPQTVLCQKRLEPLGNPCKPGFAYLQDRGRCFVILSNYSKLSRDMADAVCDAFGLSLPSFNTIGGWQAFVDWVTNMNTSLHWTSDDLEWPIQNFWIGAKHSSGSSVWKYDDSSTSFDPKAFPFPASSSSSECIVVSAASKLNWTIANCQSQSANLICQDIPKSKTCPGAFHQATPTTCYLPSDPANSYDQALAECTAAGGTLPSIHNASEWNDFLNEKDIAEVVKGKSLAESGIWLGLKDGIGDGSVWVWEDKSSFDWSHWSTGEPAAGHTCAVADLKQTGVTWKTVECTGITNYAVICQKRLVPPPKANNCSDASWTQVGDNCYKTPNDSKTPDGIYTNDGAQKICDEQGGDVPSFHSSKEWTEFNMVRRTSGSSSKSIWLGLYYSTGEFWEWTDGSNYNWSNWKSNKEPAVKTGSECVIFDVLTTDYDGGQWRMASCDSKLSVMCQQRLTPMSNPCKSRFAYLNQCNRCFIPLTNYTNLTRDTADAICDAFGLSLPSFANEAGRGAFVDWIKNMNTAKAWTAKDLVWPIANYWIGAIQDGSIWRYDDSSTKLESPMIPQSSKSQANCIISNPESNFTWTRTACDARATSLICQDIPRTKSCPGSFHPAASSSLCYLPTSSPASSYDDALSHCESSGGTLPSFHNSSEWADFLRQNDVIELVQGSTINESGIWIGLKDFGEAGSWVWEDRTSFDWSLWDAQQPGIGHKCVVADTSSTNLTWKTVECDGIKNYGTICQLRLVPPVNNDNCTSGYRRIGDNCYKAIADSSTNGTFTSNEAADKCKEQGGEIPSFHSTKEWNEFNVMRRFYSPQTNGLSMNAVWVGLRDTNQDLRWTWRDGSNYNWTNWQPEVEPTQGISLDCAVSRALSAENDDGYWTATSCDSKSAVLCQQRMQKLGNPCKKPGFAYLEQASRCFVPLTNFTVLSRDVADAICDTYGLSLPSFQSSAAWEAFVDWVDNMNTALVWRPNDRAWPIRDYWIGVRSISTASSNWQFDDSQTPFDSAAFKLPIGASGSDCVLGRASSSLDWTPTGCQLTSATNLICQDIPKRKSCPGAFRQATASVCYSQSPNPSSSYEQALSDCKAQGGTLPSFHNDSEWTDFMKQKEIVEVLQGSAISEPGIWIGLKDSLGDGSWMWEDKTDVDWMHWSGGEPSNGGASCVVADSAKYGLTWRTVGCSGNTAYKTICQLRLVKPPTKDSDNCTRDWKQMGTRCYKQPNATLDLPSNKTFTFSDAQKACDEEGGELPSFHSTDEWLGFSKMRNLISIGGGLTQSAWVGLSKENSAYWTWKDGSNYNWTYFKSGVEPKEAPGPACAVSSALGTSEGDWSSGSCFEKHGVVCQQRLTELGNPCPPGWSLVGERCYQILPRITRTPFDTATFACLDINGTLPSFGSQDQWLQFMSWKANFGRILGLNTSSFWINALYNATGNSTDWQWGDYMTQWGWTNWLSYPSTSNCIFADSDQGYKWNNADCGSKMANVICQYIDYPTGVKLSSWSSWGPCSATCDYAYQMRNRTPIIDTLSIEDSTVGEEIAEIRVCETDYCLFYWPGVGPQFRGSASDRLALDALTNSVMEYLFAQLNDSARASIGVDINSMIFDCYYDQRHCDVPGDFKLTLNTKLGNCYTYNFDAIEPKSWVQRTGRLGGLAIWLESQSEDGMCQNEAFGFKVMMHPQSEFPFPDSLGFNLDTVSVLDIMLLQEKYIRLSAPYGDCESDNTRSYLYPGDYSIEGCLRTCYQEAVVQHCGCGDPNYPLPPGVKYCLMEFKPCVDQVYDCLGPLVEAECHCPMPCFQTMYYQTQSRSQMRRNDWEADCYFRNVTNETACLENFDKRNFAVMKVYYGNKRETAYEEVPEMDLYDLFQAVTNMAQLLVNIDGVGVVEIILLIIFVIAELVKIPLCPNWEFGREPVEPSRHLKVRPPKKT